jgi:hypothetical protein
MRQAVKSARAPTHERPVWITSESSPRPSARRSLIGSRIRIQDRLPSRRKTNRSARSPSKPAICRMQIICRSKTAAKGAHAFCLENSSEPLLPSSVRSARCRPGVAADLELDLSIDQFAPTCERDHHGRSSAIERRIASHQRRVGS